MTANRNDTIQVNLAGDYFGLGGDDILNVGQPLTSSEAFSPLVSGGQGNDTYNINTSSGNASNNIVSVHENGFSSADTLNIDQNYFTNTSGVALEIGSHLFFGEFDNASSSLSGVLLLDWTENGHEIETITTGNQSFNHSSFVSTVRNWENYTFTDADPDVDSARTLTDSLSNERFIASIDSEFGEIENAVYRFYNQSTGTHFYTSSTGERNNVLENIGSFTFEGALFGFASTDGDVDVFRFFNQSTGTHFYTAGEGERDFVINNLSSLVYEGVAYSAFSTETDDTSALHRFFNTANGSHFYTADEGERDWIEDTLSDFVYEGVAYYVDVI